jgi:VanZ family protein
MNRRDRTLLRMLAPIALMAAIFYFSAQPSAEHYAWWEVAARKLGHVTGYALLTALWAWALSGVLRRPLLWAVAISLAYACTDEFHQTFVRGREGTPRDVAIDAIGMAIVVLWLRRGQLSPRPRGKVGAGGSAVRSSPAR